MEFETKYALKLFFPNSAFIQIYFEAIANALDADASQIDILISTDGNIRNPSHLQITISDDGVGFTPERFEKFKQVKEPTDPYHKGMGRLIFLNYFSTVDITSYFDKSMRTFKFTASFDGDSKLEQLADDNPSGSQLTFKGFIGERVKSYDDLKPHYLKEQIIEHFLPTLRELKNKKKKILINIKLDTTTSNRQYEFFSCKETISLKDIPDFSVKTIKDTDIDAYAEITIAYMIRNSGQQRQNLTAACIDGRTVSLSLLQADAIPIGYSAIFLFESELFSGNTDSSRQKLILPETVTESILFRTLRREISEILNAEIPIIQKRNAEAKKKFDEKYPHLTGYFEEDTVGLINPDEAIEIAQKEFFRKQKEILETDTIDESTFEKSIEISSRTLTEYILYREIIIKRLKTMTDQQKEADIHNLIVPRFKSYNGEELIDGIYSNNAWLLDDKFMTFRTILSESRMHEIIRAITLEEDQEKDDGRPDITMIFSADPADTQCVDVVVIEIKKRKVDDKENPYAATQLVKRARKLVDHCRNIQRVWYYAVIEIDNALSQLLQDMKWTPLFSKGKVFYQDFQVKRSDGNIVPTPTCLISYDAVIQDAAARNHTFLEILKSDIRKIKHASKMVHKDITD